MKFTTKDTNGNTKNTRYPFCDFCVPFCIFCGKSFPPASHPAGDHQNRKPQRHRGRKETEVTVCPQYECLEVEQPESREQHRSDDQDQPDPRPVVTERRQRRQTESYEIGRRSDSCDGNACQGSVSATEHRRAAARNCAPDASARQMMYGQIDGIPQTYQGYQHRQPVKQ
jgi:hypothetical protein